MTHYRDYFEAVAKDEKEAYKFALWCFGEGFEEIYKENLPERWNVLHGTKLQINGGEDLWESIKKMYSLFKEQAEGN